MHPPPSEQNARPREFRGRFVRAVQYFSSADSTSFSASHDFFDVGLLGLRDLRVRLFNFGSVCVGCRGLRISGVCLPNLGRFCICGHNLNVFYICLVSLEVFCACLAVLGGFYVCF